MAKRVSEMRSGRFRFDAPAAGGTDTSIKIIDGVRGKYRILNSHKTATFTVSIGGAAALPVAPKCSLDIDSTAEVVVKALANVSMEGSFDLLDAAANVRSGRFIATAATIISKGNAGAVYRVLNSGRQMLEVKTGGGDWLKVGKRQSLDIAAGNQVQIRPEGGTGTAEGIYELLHTPTVERSGRFRVPAAAIGPQRVVDLSAGSQDEKYRLFNSGDNEFQVVDSDSSDPLTPPTVLQTVGADRAIDFVVTNGTSVFVRPTTASQPIQGVLDILPR
jgi:hypothetical protein